MEVGMIVRVLGCVVLMVVLCTADAMGQQTEAEAPTEPVVLLQGTGDAPRRSLLLSSLDANSDQLLAVDVHEIDSATDQGRTVWTTFTSRSIEAVLRVRVMPPKADEALITMRVTVEKAKSVVRAVTEIDDRESVRELATEGIDRGGFEISFTRDGRCPFGVLLMDQDEVGIDASITMSAIGRALELAFMARPLSDVGTAALWSHDSDISANGVTVPIRQRIRLESVGDGEVQLSAGTQGSVLVTEENPPYWIQSGSKLASCEVRVEGTASARWNDTEALPVSGTFERESVARAEYTLKSDGVQATYRTKQRLVIGPVQ
jgi:hypothetical protein